MSDLYTAAEVQAAARAYWRTDSDVSDGFMERVLDAVAPAIAARALREFADWAESSDLDAYPFDGLDATVQTIRARADELERP